MDSILLVWQTWSLQERLLIVFAILLSTIAIVFFYLEYQANAVMQDDKLGNELIRLEKIIAKANSGDEDAIQICENDFRIIQNFDTRDIGEHKKFSLTSVARQQLQQLKC